MANYLENTWAKISGLFDAFPSPRDLEQDYYDPAKKSLMGFADNVGDYMSSALGGEPVRVIEKSRPATTEYVVPNQEPLDVQLRQGYAESIVPQDRGKIDITDIQAQEQTNDVISNMGYMTPQQMQDEVKARQPVKTADEVKDEMESTLTDNTMQNLKAQDDLNAQMSGAEATQNMMEQNYDMNQPPKGVMDFVSKQGGTTQDAVSLLSMADAGAITQDNANAIVQQVSANATPDQMNASLEDALERADTDRQIMEAEYDFNKDMQGGMNIADKVEAGEVEPSFWDKTKKFLADEETMLTLAQSFNTMRLEPDDALGKSIDKRLETIRKNKGVSATVSTVRSMAMSETDPIKKRKLLEAATFMEKNPQDSSKIYSEVVKGLVGGEYDKEKFDQTQKLRKEFMGLGTLKSFGEQSDAFGRIVASAEPDRYVLKQADGTYKEVPEGTKNAEPKWSGAADLALVFNYMKVLDPGSVVRESEFKNAADAGAWLEKQDKEGRVIPRPVRIAIDKMMDGNFLGEQQRNDFVNRANQIYAKKLGEYDTQRDMFTNIAKKSSLNVDEAVPDIYGINRKYVETPKQSALPKGHEATQIPAEDWEAFYQSLPWHEKVRIIKVLNRG